MNIPRHISRLGQVVSAVNGIIDFVRRIRPRHGSFTELRSSESGTSISAVFPASPAAGVATPGHRIGVATITAVSGDSYGIDVAEIGGDGTPVGGTVKFDRTMLATHPFPVGSAILVNMADVEVAA